MSFAGGDRGQPLARHRVGDGVFQRQGLAPLARRSHVTAGADLVQLYTGLIFRGPGLPRVILAGLGRILAERGFASVGDAVGCEVEGAAAESLTPMPS